MSGRLLEDAYSKYNRYQVVELLYDGRPARLLFSGERQAAQSGIPLDGRPEMLFDYNQRLMELLERRQPANVLMIGGGGCTLPTAALASLPGTAFKVIEPDETVTELARRHFGLAESKRLKILTAEGRSWLEESTEIFDVIIVDAFSDSTAPSSLLTLEACEALKKHLGPDGLCAVNTISAGYGAAAENDKLSRQLAAYQQTFASVTIYPASRSLLSYQIPQNFILVASALPIELELKYPPLRTETVVSSAPLRDKGI